MPYELNGAGWRREEFAWPNHFTRLRRPACKGRRSTAQHMDPGHIFREHGPTYFPYLVMVCAMFENDVTFLMAGIYAASVRPHLSPSVAVVAGAVGALCHDTFWFALARHRSKWIRETRVWKKIGPQIEQWGYRFGVRELFMARFIPGTRNPS